MVRYYPILSFPSMCFLYLAAFFTWVSCVTLKVQLTPKLFFAEWNLLIFLITFEKKFRDWQNPRVSMAVWTGGHFACACVHPLNDNSVGASNLMAGNQKLARKVTVLLKAISLVLWIPYFSMTKIGRFQRGFSLVDFSAVRFLDLLKT